MMNLTRRIALGVLTLSLLLGASAAQQDKIVAKDGKERTAKIASEDYDGLKLSVEGGTTSVPWKDVDSIRYSNAGKYHEALDTFENAGPKDALALLEALAADDKLRPVLRHGALYHLGVVQQRLGETDKAIATFEQLLQQFPRSRYLIQTGTNLLALYVSQQNPAGATKILDATLTAARASGTGGGLQAGFDFLRGRILEEQQKFAEAERLFDGAATGAATVPEIAFPAKLGIARCAQRAGRTNDAERRYRELVTADAPNEILAGAWNGLADLALADGTTKRDPDVLRNALFSYLRGVVLYVPGRAASSEEYERALAGASRAFRAIGELDSDAARKKLFLDRARDRKEHLAAEFPRSRHLQGL